MPPAGFVSGLDLCRGLYLDAVRPLLQKRLPGLAHSAARIGAGSEVLGFDTARSTDHDWGPRLQLFLGPADAEEHAAELDALLRAELPKTVHGYPTNFAPTGDGQVAVLRHTEGPVAHRIEVSTVDSWCAARLGFDPRDEIGVFDWLATPTQILAECTAGAVFHDGLGDLGVIRTRLAWYPEQVWRYLLACQWQRLSQEEAFVGRCGEVGDELGGALTAARLARELIRLLLLLHRRYPPYGKWLGSAFARLPVAATVGPTLRAAVRAADTRDRAEHLAAAYRAVAEEQNALGLTEPVDPTPRPYHDRPYQVLHAERFVAALRAGLTDPTLLALPLTGAVDQFADSTDLLTRPGRCRAVTSALINEAT